jgi:hypothetical protein
MECDVLVQLDDAVERSLAGQRYKRAADGKKNESNVNM